MFVLCVFVVVYCSPSSHLCLCGPCVSFCTSLLFCVFVVVYCLGLVQFPFVAVLCLCACFVSLWSFLCVSVVVYVCKVGVILHVFVVICVSVVVRLTVPHKMSTVTSNRGSNPAGAPWPLGPRGLCLVGPFSNPSQGHDSHFGHFQNKMKATTF